MPPAWRVRLVAGLLAALSLAGAGAAARGDLAALQAAPADGLQLPRIDGSLRFAVIGDSGSGSGAQRAIASRMIEYHRRFPFELVLMLGDNLYGRQSLGALQRRFYEPYRPLLESGVRFYASLGNHDSREQRFYLPFNMGGRTYYSFTAPRQDVRFFALESDFMDAAQLAWLEHELQAASEAWKIAFMHHPLYSSGRRHGPDLQLREQLEPLFVRYGVSAVFAGHEHFYERTHPQQDIAYFISGSAGKLRRGNIRRDSPLSAAGFDEDHAFMLVEIAGDELHFQVISRAGWTVDAGTVHRSLR